MQLTIANKETTVSVYLGEEKELFPKIRKQ